MLRLDADKPVSFCDGFNRRDFFHVHGTVGAWDSPATVLRPVDLSRALRYKFVKTAGKGQLRGGIRRRFFESGGIPC